MPSAWTTFPVEYGGTVAGSPQQAWSHVSTGDPPDLGYDILASGGTGPVGSPTIVAPRLRVLRETTRLPPVTPTYRDSQTVEQVVGVVDVSYFPDYQPTPDPPGRMAILPPPDPDEALDLFGEPEAEWVEYRPADGPVVRYLYALDDWETPVPGWEGLSFWDWLWWAGFDAASVIDTVRIDLPDGVTCASDAGTDPMPVWPTVTVGPGGDYAADWVSDSGYHTVGVEVTAMRPSLDSVLATFTETSATKAVGASVEVPFDGVCGPLLMFHAAPPIQEMTGTVSLFSGFASKTEVLPVTYAHTFVGTAMPMRLSVGGVMRPYPLRQRGRTDGLIGAARQRPASLASASRQGRTLIR